MAKEGSSQEQGDGTDVLGKRTIPRVVSNQSLATNIKVGQRMPSFQVLNQADAHPWHFQELLKSNGRWRVVVFASNIKDAAQSERLQSLGKALAAPDSFLGRYTAASKSYDSVIEVLTVHTAPRQQTTIFDFPDVFRPWSDDGWDYWKIFVDDESYHNGHGQAYQNYGVDPTRGCAVILRPDQYVSYVGEMDDYESLNNFFSGFMLPQKF